jgi:copper chaperone CopZ
MLVNDVIEIKNMMNEADAKKVIDAMEHVWGVQRVEVRLSQNQAVYSYDERMASHHDFKQAVIEAGYEVTE